VEAAMTRYARFEVNLIAFAAALLTVVVGWSAGWWGLLPALLGVALLAFYRDPPRRGCRDRDVLLAPADGRVMSVTRSFEDGDGAGPALRIVIFLSVFDVHVNRSPCAGRVARVDYHPGRFLSALRAAADSVNESNTLTIIPQPPLPGPVTVRQIAGALARRIVCAVGPQDTLSAGQRFGMIKLGSQTELRVPEDPRWCEVVQAGARVYAGRTVLARLAAGQP
jgi:phosphatidylserine decarboxylase